MNLDRALQYNTAALAVMGALFLGLGHESVVLPVALALAAVLSVGLSDRYTWLRLNRLIANLIALAAVCWSMRNFFRAGTEGQLLAIADMLVYLQIVLFFQEKSGRVYWQLIVLSLLQVVVAAALNLGPQFGLLLAAYMITAVAGLVLLCSYREWRKFGSREHRLAETTAPAWQSLLGEPAARAPQAVADASSAARPAPIARQVGLLAAAIVAFAGVFFFATPRHHDGAWAEMRGGSHTSSGMVAQVALKESGRIHLSSQLVMRVTLSSASTGEPVVLVNEPYFHGLALTDYVHDQAGGRWVVGRNQGLARQFSSSPPDRSPPVTSLVRQHYLLEGSPNQLFAILPIQSLDRQASDLEVRPFSNRIVRTGSLDDRRTVRDFSYITATSSLRNGRQLHGVPNRNRKLSSGDQVLFDHENEALLRFDRGRFPGLTATADRVLAEAGMQQANPLEQALALERHFTQPGQYRYSLTLDFTRDPKLDPIEDFVVNHRTGHCEYFASALVLMLRSRGIPARMILGYKGGDFNTIGDYYQVRQKHAHAWVEARLDPGIAPEWEMAGPPSGGGTWYRLDPTPSSFRATSASADEGVAWQVMQTFDYVELLWRDYVLSLNALKQKDSIYEPMSNRALASLPSWVEGRGLRRLMRRVSRMIGLDPSALEARSTPNPSAFDWRSGTLVVGLVIAGIVAVQTLYSMFWLLRRWRPAEARTARTRRPATPAFFRRLESLLARLPLRRAPGQTARELANAAALRLNAGRPQAEVARLPATIVAAYYRVRFGGAALDSHEQAAIEHALAELTPAVHQAQR